MQSMWILSTKKLRNAGIKAGMNIKAKTSVLKSLTVLRKKQSIEKSKSGKKAPRRIVHPNLFTMSNYSLLAQSDYS